MRREKERYVPVYIRKTQSIDPSVPNGPIAASRELAPGNGARGALASLDSYDKGGAQVFRNLICAYFKKYALTYFAKNLS